MAIVFTMNQVKQTSAKEEVLISVVIATYNGYEYIDRCLHSFTEQSLEPELFEVIVVNNNSSDQTSQIVTNYVEEYANFTLVDEHRPGVSFARNTGIEAARGRYICFMDDDAYADTYWLEKVRKAFQDISPSPAVVGGRILPYYTIAKPDWFHDSFEIRTKGSTARFLSRSECNFGFPESNFSVSKKVLEELGNFSTEYGPKGDEMSFGEGSELSARIAKKYPHFWYDPDIFVYHLVPKRNMSVKYILSRRYKSAQKYQALRSPTEGLISNVILLAWCILRIFFYAVLSILFVRWFTKRAVSDWLSHVIKLVNLSSRSIYIVQYLLKSTPAKKS